MQRASTMLMPASANVRERSSSRRWRSHASTWSSTLKRGLVVAVPGTRHEALRVLAQRHGVRAVLAVDRDPAAERDVAEDRVARHRPAALGQPQRDVVDALDADAVAATSRLRPAAAPCALVRAGPRRPIGSSSAASPCLSRCMHLVDDDLRRDLRAAERDVEVVGLAEAHLADHVGQQRRAGDLLRRQAGLVEVLLQQLAAGVLGVVARLGLEPGADLVARARRLDQRQPVARRAALALGGEDLDDVAGLQLVVQRDDLAVDLGADAAVADVGVDLVGEVQRRRAGGQRLDLALGREDEDLLLDQLAAQVVGELARVVRVALPVEQRLQPLELRRRSGRSAPLRRRPPCSASARRRRTRPSRACRACGSGSPAAGPRARSPSCGAPGTC